MLKYKVAPRDYYNIILKQFDLTEEELSSCSIKDYHRYLNYVKIIQCDEFFNFQKFEKINKNIFIFLLGWYFDENSTIYNLPAEIILSIAQKAYYSEDWPEYLLPLVEKRFVKFQVTY